MKVYVLTAANNIGSAYKINRRVDSVYDNQVSVWNRIEQLYYGFLKALEMPDGTTSNCILKVVINLDHYTKSVTIWYEDSIDGKRHFVDYSFCSYDVEGYRIGTKVDVISNGLSVLYQCKLCGEYISKRDNYCKHCGTRFTKTERKIIDL